MWKGQKLQNHFSYVDFVVSFVDPCYVRKEKERKTLSHWNLQWCFPDGMLKVINVGGGSTCSISLPSQPADDQDDELRSRKSVDMRKRLFWSRHSKINTAKYPVSVQRSAQTFVVGSQKQRQSRWVIASFAGNSISEGRSPTDTVGVLVGVWSFLTQFAPSLMVRVWMHTNDVIDSSVSCIKQHKLTLIMPDLHECMGS